MIVGLFKSQAPGNPSQPRSLREAVVAIDNIKDLNDFVAAQHAKIQPKAEVKYERNPVGDHASRTRQSRLGILLTACQILNPPSSATTTNQATTLSMHPPQTSGQTTGPQGPFSPPAPVGLHGGTANARSGNQGIPPEAPREFPMPHTRSFSQGAMLNQRGGPQQQFAPRTSSQANARYGNGGSVSSQGPPRLGALPFQGSQQQPQQSASPDRQNSGVHLGSAAPPSYAPPAQGSASKPIFGVPLARLYERDGLAVPMVVHQCIQAVDLFGLGVEGIYRQSGSLNHINKLKGMFDAGMSRPVPSPRARRRLTGGLAESQNPALDFRNPENFFHDVNSATGLLKHFFRDLPDPILTTEHHDAFIAAASKRRQPQPRGEWT